MKALSLILMVVPAWLGVLSKSFAPFIAGYLQVNILPAGAVTAGAQWSLDAATPVHDGGTAYPTIQGSPHGLLHGHLQLGHSRQRGSGSRVRPDQRD